MVFFVSTILIKVKGHLFSQIQIEGVRLSETTYFSKLVKSNYILGGLGCLKFQIFHVAVHP